MLALKHWSNRARIGPQDYPRALAAAFRPCDRAALKRTQSKRCRDSPALPPDGRIEIEDRDTHPGASPQPAFQTRNA